MADVLLVEPWFGGSHRQWAEGLQRHSVHDIRLLALPDEAWKWRMRGSAITLAEQVTERPDVVLASSLLDLPSFLSHARLESVPSVLYMHENQLTYPVPEGASRDRGLGFINWSSVVRADRVLFNSSYHRDAFFAAAEQMLKSLPDPTHLGLIDGCLHKSTVIPVGVDLDWIDPAAKSEPPVIVWNQRWEHDKDPDSLVWALGELARSGVDFRAAICGEAPFGQVPESLGSLPDLLGDRLVQFGEADRGSYEAILNDASVVVSTALHEFFGIAVVEAMAAGARPVLPNRLSYPELLPPVTHGEALYETRTQLLGMLELAVREPHGLAGLAESMQRFAWSAVIDLYDDELRAAIP